MVLELTVVRVGLFFSWSPYRMFLQVIWVIGLSMVMLGLLVGCGVSSRWIGILGALIVLGHNLLDLGAGPPALGTDRLDRAAPRTLLFTLLLRPGRLPLGEGVNWFVGYSLLPWFGIMALGYTFSQVLILERPTRVRIMAALGLEAIVAFTLLRVSGLYGNPKPFQAQDTPSRTVIAFLNCEKYPPSLLFALMTLGPGLLMLAALDTTDGAIAVHGQQASALPRALLTLGRVPLFYYVLQWPVIRLMATVEKVLAGHPLSWSSGPFDAAGGGDFGLPFAYLMWALVVAILYVPAAGTPG